MHTSRPTRHADVRPRLNVLFILVSNVQGRFPIVINEIFGFGNLYKAQPRLKKLSREKK